LKWYPCATRVRKNAPLCSNWQIVVNSTSVLCFKKRILEVLIKEVDKNIKIMCVFPVLPLVANLSFGQLIFSLSQGEVTGFFEKSSDNLAKQMTKIN
jgi:hypothetical protein